MPRRQTRPLTGCALVRRYFGDSAVTLLGAWGQLSVMLTQLLAEPRSEPDPSLDPASKTLGLEVNLPPWGWNGVVWTKSSISRHETVH